MAKALISSYVLVQAHPDYAGNADKEADTVWVKEYLKLARVVLNAMG